MDLLPADLLREVIRFAVQSHKDTEEGRISDTTGGDLQVQGREVIKPANLCKCSPRIFWSLVHRYGANIHESIREALRGLDDNCDWLEERKRELSEKAKENLAQKQEAMRSSELRRRKKQKGGEAVEVSVEATSSSSSSSRSPRIAQPNFVEAKGEEAEQLLAATVYLRTQLSEIPLDSELLPEEWIIPVNNYLAEEKGKEDGGGGGGGMESGPVPGLAAIDACPRNRNRLVEKKLALVKAEKKEDRGGGGGEKAADFTTLPPSRVLSLDQLESWVAAAQARLVGFLWRAICGGGCERLRRAMEKVMSREG